LRPNELHKHFIPFSSFLYHQIHIRYLFWLVHGRSVVLVAREFAAIDVHLNTNAPKTNLQEAHLCILDGNNLPNWRFLGWVR